MRLYRIYSFGNELVFMKTELHQIVADAPGLGAVTPSDLFWVSVVLALAASAVTVASWLQRQKP
jgi:hypothetical protein